MKQSWSTVESNAGIQVDQRYSPGTWQELAVSGLIGSHHQDALVYDDVSATDSLSTFFGNMLLADTLRYCILNRAGSRPMYAPDLLSRGKLVRLP